MEKKKIDRYQVKLRTMMHEWAWVFGYIRRYWLGVSSFILLGIISTLMSLLTSVASRDLINAAVGVADAPHELVTALCIMIGLAVGKLIFQSIATWISTNVRVKITNEVRTEIFSKIMSSRWESIRDYHSGEIINRLEGDVGSVVSGIINFLPNLISYTIQFVGAFVIILVAGNAWMALFALASAPILVLSAKPLMKIMRRFNEQNRKINGEVLSFNEEALQNIQLVKAFDLVKQRCRLLRELLEKHRKVQISYAKVSVLVGLAMGVIGLLAAYGCYGVAVYMLYKGEINYGTMTLFLQLSSTLSSSFSGLVSLVPSVISVATSAGRVMEVTQLPAETDADRSVAKAMLKQTDRIGLVVEARDMTFAYGDSPSPVMDRVNFVAETGEIVAFIGPSGGGKTTMLRLLLGLLEPQEGSLTVRLADGSSELRIGDSTRRLCSYVPQGNSVFSGTIRDNLTIGAPHATDEQIREALEIADAWDFVSAQPDGVDTVLGERGVNLSEGQLQRLAIARAILRKSPILIMDEATSALDVDTEARVLKAVMQNDPHRICFLTTHRTSMLAYADKIVQVNGDGCFTSVDPTPYRRSVDLPTA